VCCWPLDLKNFGLFATSKGIFIYHFTHAISRSQGQKHFLIAVCFKRLNIYAGETCFEKCIVCVKSKAQFRKLKPPFSRLSQMSQPAALSG
jgi:hypothetical protein